MISRELRRREDRPSSSGRTIPRRSCASAFAGEAVSSVTTTSPTARPALGDRDSCQTTSSRWPSARKGQNATARAKLTGMRITSERVGGRAERSPAMRPNRGPRRPGDACPGSTHRSRCSGRAGLGSPARSQAGREAGLVVEVGDRADAITQPQRSSWRRIARRTRRRPHPRAASPTCPRESGPRVKRPPTRTCLDVGGLGRRRCSCGWCDCRTESFVADSGARAAGRGAYVCPAPSCVERALSRGRLGPRVQEAQRSRTGSRGGGARRGSARGRCSGDRSEPRSRVAVRGGCERDRRRRCDYRESVGR